MVCAVRATLGVSATGALQVSSTGGVLSVATRLKVPLLEAS